MKAMILCAGRGSRMRPLTDITPKPLLKLGSKRLVEWHLERLSNAGFKDIVINYAWLGEQFPKTLGDGSRWNLNINYSPEPEGGLETAGGIAYALDILGDDPILVINGDIWCNWKPSEAYSYREKLEEDEKDAFLVLVDNPQHNPKGDFTIDNNGKILAVETREFDMLTFAGIGVYRPSIFSDIAKGDFVKLAPLLRTLMTEDKVIGHYFKGLWFDIGTPERLNQINNLIGNLNEEDL
ncbi:N-acetylmuramate alpha-1-phosphate uridylyltransferase MurU [Taylorella equigenitalis]|uniref:Glucose-1-phosphate thymidylyltransferase n=3 Tax=Taylorella equigenitalis TaxID=29575 RepID=A0A654KFR8_TAYEM|nr:nucleotidyltransferase family protein [Taylorella equigenitalis]ADU91274.1 Glucose-1-phosphate thymidylyltransferase [Taylorella equigenitalis MCE9]AFN36371.1 putative nucleotidyl transferase [Taylorella equigenitalis ATCC 35865]ASY30940.1 mannose-1-phosphate guanylyltransferase [Taylorella equigenitalis]ASY38244.1 nucleotidyltransferase family protein [Taylorella equigenitalis]ASY39773.1 mannose-1-phosphate guanylyltransferase [Taylorella equigenitalis]